MKLITLNIWGAHVYQPLKQFISDHDDVDIFCFQEIYRKAPDKITNEDRWVSLDFFTEIEILLPNHTGFFRPIVNEIYGIAIFVSKKIKVIGEGAVLIYENTNYCGVGPRHSRELQWVECMYNKKQYTVMNVHGLWNGQGKTDTLDRLLQAKNTQAFTKNVKTPKILCGDFNLRPDTESIKIIGEGMHDLIQTHHITDTRTSFYNKPERYADYVFTSKDIQVNHFSVLPDQVSDHAPLLLEIL